MNLPEEKTRCPHCGEQLRIWNNPQLVCWSDEYQYVCFNDACPYFVRGWDWMRAQFNVNASYRYRLDPRTGDCGPLPVWSVEALKNHLRPEGDLKDDRI